MPDPDGRWVAGVDGCKSGWIAALFPLGRKTDLTVKIVERFTDLLALAPALSVLAVDMPIGLPDRLEGSGRGPEQAARQKLGQRQSSVFTVPARAAVYQDDYQAACLTALQTSDPPRKVSKQCFYLFPKIREIDRLMTPALEQRVYEVHPELAFWRLNGECEMSLPKKIKSRANPDGLDQRRDLLVQHGLPKAVLDMAPPRGAGRDDLLDAAANALIAERIVQGLAVPFPREFQRDAKGLRAAIWA
ncbi:hypothetical protein GCM10011316_08270 [Roseibium aquae]|uniref:RNase H-like nuclease n=1 Tax=Roseibium aquae TaxID=1323746 RepID=A0A916TBH4_9HYPH|nr:DUF429 domain-containing protein [Roseibium aquae]GGB38576.1 hypothetical protein GCM10011316_08270 [Roseibium aquae]